jgi:hypothetical protein
MSTNQNADEQDSVGDNTLLVQEQESEAGEQQPVDDSAADSSQENQSETGNEAVVEKRLRDTQAKVTELAEQLKVAQSQLQVISQPRVEPFDEDKFIDEFIGGDDAYNKFRDDPAILAKELSKKFMRHNAQVIADIDKRWEQRLNGVMNTMKTKDPEYVKLAEELKEIEDAFDLSGMSTDDKVKLAKMISSKRTGRPAPPPGPSARKVATQTRPSSVPAGYLESLGLAGESKNNNTLL